MKYTDIAIDEIASGLLKINGFTDKKIDLYLVDFMNLFFKELQLVNTIEGAIKELEKQIDISPKLNEIIDFIIEAHEGQFRKVVNPIRFIQFL